MDEWKDGGVEGWMSGRMKEWKDGGVEGWRSGRMDEWKDGKRYMEKREKRVERGNRNEEWMEK